MSATVARTKLDVSDPVLVSLFERPSRSRMVEHLSGQRIAVSREHTIAVHDLVTA